VVLSLVILIEFAILLAILWTQGVSPDIVLIFSVVLILAKLLSLLALSLLFATIVSPSIAMFMTIASAIIGHGGYVVLEYAMRSGSTLYLYFAKAVLIVFPNLESLNLKNLVGTTAHIQLETYAIALGLSLLYSFIILVLTAYIFEKKSFDAV